MHTLASSAPASVKGVFNSWLFWGFAIFVLFAMLGSTGTWQSEDRWLEVAREMRMSGNYFFPTINQDLYFDKPLLGYWLVILSAIFTGAINEWALRIPSAIAALIVLWSTREIARKIWSEQEAHWAGWLLITSYGFLLWGRLGESDMENVAATTLAVACYWRWRDQFSFIKYLLFYLILFVGAQCKGLPAIVIPALVIAPDLLKNKRFLSHINLKHLIAIAMGAAVYIAPFLLSHPNSGAASTQQSGIDLVIKENVQRYLNPFDHTGPIYTYLIAIPTYFFPWSILLIGALVKAIQEKYRQDDANAWVCNAFLLIFLFYTLSGSRRIYYILPAIPYCALLVARWINKLSNEKHLLVQLTQWILWIVAALELISLAAGKTLMKKYPEVNLSFFIGTSIIGASAFALHWLTKKWLSARPNQQQTQLLLAIPIVVFSGFFLFQQLVLDSYRTKFDFFADLGKLKQENPALETGVFMEHISGAFVYYSNLPMPITNIENHDQLAAFLAKADHPKLLVTSEMNAHKLPKDISQTTPAIKENTHSWEKNMKDKYVGWKIDWPTPKN